MTVSESRRVQSFGVQREPIASRGVGQHAHLDTAPTPVSSEQWCGDEARAYGAACAHAQGFVSRTWQEVEPLVRSGWASRHRQVCNVQLNWRITWPAVREGWRDAGGTFEEPALGATTHASEPALHDANVKPPSVGAHVFDAFGEPAGRVKAVREHDFLLARPLARDVYVPFSAIRWPGRSALRISVSNGEIATMSWQRPKLLGIFGT
jgi:hypothetical protein